MALDGPETDFYRVQEMLEPDERELVARTREFMLEHVSPLLTEHWSNATFPHEIIAPMAELDIMGAPFDGPGCRAGRFLLDGLISMEISRVDPSIATFRGVQGGLALGSIELCGSDEQRERWTPPLASMELIGAFGLTEPDVGSGASRGLKSTARREGDEWILNGAKRWIGNATFADLTVIWAVDEADEQVKAFVVEKNTPGFVTTKIENKTALRIVQNGDIELTDVRVPEANRLANANSFMDTARVLLMARAGVAWMAVGCAYGAYDYALEYARTREQFGRPIGSFQLIQDLLVRQLGNITASMTMCAQLANMQDAGTITDAQASLAKAFCSVRTRESVAWARELMGGNGILTDRHVARFVGDAEAIYSYEGTREMNTLIVGRAITGLSAFV